MDFCFKDTTQVSKKVVMKPHKFPKYGKSTTDPTYYEPAANRIANMKKASGFQLEGIYDFYSKEDVDKFSSENFDKNIQNAKVDVRFNNKLLPEEVSQITTTMAYEAQEAVDSKKSETSKNIKEAQKTIAIAKEIQKSSDSPAGESE